MGDFNIAKVLKEDFTQTQIGSPSYLAPEVWNQESYSYNCDVFSLGCVFFQFASLKLPFEAISMDDLYKKINNQQVTRIPTKYSDDLNSVIRIMLTKNPRIRPSVDDLIQNASVRLKIKELNLRPNPASETEPQMLMATINLPTNFSKLNQVFQKYKKARAVSVSDRHTYRDLSFSSRKVSDNLKGLKEKRDLETSNVSTSKATPADRSA